MARFSSIFGSNSRRQGTAQARRQPATEENLSGLLPEDRAAITEFQQAIKAVAVANRALAGE